MSQSNSCFVKSKTGHSCRSDTYKTNVYTPMSLLIWFSWMLNLFSELPNADESAQNGDMYVNVNSESLKKNNSLTAMVSSPAWF